MQMMTPQRVGPPWPLAALLPCLALALVARDADDGTTSEYLAVARTPPAWLRVLEASLKTGAEQAIHKFEQSYDPKPLNGGGREALAQALDTEDWLFRSYVRRGGKPANWSAYVEFAASNGMRKQIVGQLHTSPGLKLLDVGRARTGTQSIMTALRKLGYNAAHGEQVFGHLEAESIFMSAYNSYCKRPIYARAGYSTPENLERKRKYILRKGWNATLDAPFWPMTKELVAMFPEAKVLLSVHPKGGEGWLDSIKTNIIGTRNHPEVIGLPPGTNKSIFFGCSCGVPVQAHWPLPEPLRTNCIREYEAYEGYIRSIVPEERLLVYNVTQGWAPLCDFLGVDQGTCPETPFPKADLFKQLARQGSKLPHWIAAHGRNIKGKKPS